MLERLGPDFKILAKEPPKPPEVVAALEAHFGYIPDEYRELIQEAGDLELHYMGKKYIRIWGAHGPAYEDESYELREQIPGIFPIGDNGGCEFLFYHDGRRGPGLYTAHTGDFCDEESEWIAPSPPGLPRERHRRGAFRPRMTAAGGCGLVPETTAPGRSAVGSGTWSRPQPPARKVM